MSRSTDDISVSHPFPPVFDSSSRTLILGSFPSVKSREQNFYYGHPSNRFWKMLAVVLDCPIPESVSDKKQMLLDNNIALWDVVFRCEICGSSDSSIKNVVPNDISSVLSSSDVRRIILNGKTAQKYYDKYFKDRFSVDVICLPSTSPANAAWSMEKLVKKWSVITQ